MDEVYPKCRADVHARVVEGEMLILDRREGVIHQLNRTASYIWACCNGHMSVAAIAQQLAEVFDIDAARAAQDVAMLVDQLQQLGLLDPCPAHPKGAEAIPDRSVPVVSHD